MLLIALGVTVVAGGAGVHYWNQRHDLVEVQLRQQFEQIAPELRLMLGRTQLDGLHRLTLHDVELLDRATDQPLFRAGAISVHLDSQALLDHQRVIVRSVRVDGAELLLIRRQDGRWNWQDYEFSPPPSGRSSLPEVDIRHLRVLLHLKHGQGIPSARLLLTSPQLQAVPSSAHSLDLLGAVVLSGAGELQLSGSCDLAKGTWSLAGQMNGVTADEHLLELARTTSPKVHSELQQLDRTLQSVLPAQQTVAVDPDSALLIGNSISKAPRFQGKLDVKFDIGQRADETIPEFRLLVDVEDGRVSVPGVPVQLAEVEAVFFANNTDVVLRVDRSTYDGAEVSGQFQMKTTPGAAPPAGSVRLISFPITRQLYPVCPDNIQRLFDRFDPQLRLSGTAQFHLQPGGKWVVENLTAGVHDGRMKYHRFQYPLTDIRAELRQRPLQQTNGMIVVDVIRAAGMAAEHPWTAHGTWINPGPAVESHFEMHVEDFALDSRFRQALEPPSRRVIDKLDLTGTAWTRAEDSPED